MKGMNIMMEMKKMKYRIYINPHGGYDVYALKNEGCGWSRIFHSHYSTRAQAEKAMVALITYI